MAIIISSPGSTMVDVSQSPIMIEWQDSTEGQEAYELLYKFKKADVWSTCGKVYDTEARSVSLNSIYDHVGVDFYECFYRVIIYYNGENELGSVTGRETSDAYYAVFRHGIANTLKLYDGSGQFDYNIFDEIATDDSKTNREVEVINIALDETGTKLKAPIVAQDSILKSNLRICVDTSMPDIKNVAQDVALFPGTGIYGQTYMNQKTTSEYNAYGYTYGDHFNYYRYYTYMPHYAPKAYYENEDVYNYRKEYGEIYAYGEIPQYNVDELYGYRSYYYYKPYYGIDEGYEDIDIYETKPKYRTVYWYYVDHYYHYYYTRYDWKYNYEYYNYKPYVTTYHTETNYGSARGYGYEGRKAETTKYGTRYDGVVYYTYWKEYYYWTYTSGTRYDIGYKYGGDLYHSYLYFDPVTGRRQIGYVWDGGYFTYYIYRYYYTYLYRNYSQKPETGNKPVYSNYSYNEVYWYYTSYSYNYSYVTGYTNVPHFEYTSFLAGYRYGYKSYQHPAEQEVRARGQEDVLDGYYYKYAGRTGGNKYYYYKITGYDLDHYDVPEVVGYYYYLQGHWWYYYVSGYGEFYSAYFDYNYSYIGGYHHYVDYYYKSGDAYGYYIDYRYNYSYITRTDYNYYYYLYYNS